MRFKLVFLWLVMACDDDRAAVQAKKRDPNAQCVAPHQGLAFCQINRLPYWCDSDSCLPAMPASALPAPAEKADFLIAPLN